MPPRPSAALLVAAGGASGSVARWGLAQEVGGASATLLVNLVGCLLVGLLAGWAGEDRPRLRLVLGVGFLGGFTTFSTHLLVASSLSVVAGAAYVVATVVGCVALAATGLRIGRARRIGRRR